MSRESALVKNTIIIAIGKICTQFVSFFLLPFYTNVLSTEEFGAVDLLNTLVGLLLPIVTFQVEQAVFRDLIEIRHQEKEKRAVVSSAFFSVCLQCLVFFISPFGGSSDSESFFAFSGSECNCIHFFFLVPTDCKGAWE